MSQFYSYRFLLFLLPCFLVPLIELGQPQLFGKHTIAWIFWLAYYLFFATLHIGLTYSWLLGTSNGRNWLKEAKQEGILSFWRTGTLVAALLIYSYLLLSQQTHEGISAVFMAVSFLILRGIVPSHHFVSQQSGLLKLEGRKAKGDDIFFLSMAIIAIVYSSLYLAKYNPNLAELRKTYLSNNTPWLLSMFGISIAAGFTIYFARLGHNILKDRFCALGCLVLWSLHPVTESAAYCVAAVHGTEYAKFFFRQQSGLKMRDARTIKIFALGFMALAASLFIWNRAYHSIFPFLGDPDSSWKYAILSFQGMLALLHVHFDSLMFRRTTLRTKTTLAIEVRGHRPSAF